MGGRGFDLTTTYVHLGQGGLAHELPGFAWTEEYLASYDALARPDGSDGRLVCISPLAGDWPVEERHPAGEELVVVLSGRVVVSQLVDGEVRRVELGPDEAVVNPAGCWHTADVLEAGRALYVTPGLGTEHRARTLPPARP